LVPPEITEQFLGHVTLPAASRLVYRPALLATARLHFVDSKAGLDVWRTLALLAQPPEAGGEAFWAEAQELDSEKIEFGSSPDPAGAFSAPAPDLLRPKSYSAWGKQLKDHLYRDRTLNLWFCPSVKTWSGPQEQESDFRLRLGQLAREQRDRDVEKLRQQYAPKLKSLADRIQRAEERVAREKAQYSQEKFQTVLSVGGSLLGALFGRKLASATTVSKATTAMRGVGRSMRQRSDVDRAAESVEELQRQLDELEQELKAQVATLEQTVRADQIALEAYPIRPRKTDLAVDRLLLAWVPWKVSPEGIAELAIAGR
jgi:hypothetical protein